MSAANVIISWSEPFTGGQNIPVQSYSIKLKTALGVMSEVTVLCDGTDSTVVSTRSCTVPMSGITAPQAFSGSGENIGGLALS